MIKIPALALSLVVAASGCGAILNSSTATINGPAGATVDGAPVPVVVSQKSAHVVRLPDGQVCTLGSSASGGYIIADIFLTGLLGLLIDGATGDWRTVDTDGCPGVTAN